jgi:hypothetical protein
LNSTSDVRIFSKGAIWELSSTFVLSLYHVGYL